MEIFKKLSEKIETFKIINKNFINEELSINDVIFGTLISDSKEILELNENQVDEIRNQTAVENVEKENNQAEIQKEAQLDRLKFQEERLEREKQKSEEELERKKQQLEDKEKRINSLYQNRIK